MHNRPVIKVKVGGIITLNEIAREAVISDENEIKSILENQIREHYFLYGVEPFKLEFSRAKDGYLLKPNSVIGRINCKSFILEISSKFDEIEIGKWLQIAHYSAASNLVKHDNDVVEKNVSDYDVLSGIDYFSLSFVSAVYDCVNQGLLYGKNIVTVEDPHLKGKLNISRHVQKGGNPFYPQTLQNAKNYNNDANQIIKKALETCIVSSKNSKVRNVANGLLVYFDGVASDKLYNSSINYEFVSSLPRPDYEKALALSKIILEGVNPLEGSDSSFSPFFTINLDVLFEVFVAFELKRMLKEKNYIVEAQEKHPHPITPVLEGNFIAPDLLAFKKNDPVGKKVVLDTKNKYSLLYDCGKPRLSNQDLYQIIYYCQALKTDIAILVYPGDNKNSTKYPLKGSIGLEKYKEKRLEAINKMFDSGNTAFVFAVNNVKINVIAWRLNLSGTLHETRESVAQLSQFVADCVQKEILSN